MPGHHVIKVGSATYLVPAKEHAANLQHLKTIPHAMKEIEEIGNCVRGKPRYLIKIEDTKITVVREDYQRELQCLIVCPEAQIANRMSISEWKSDVIYRGEGENYPVTMHDVYEQFGVTVKTGNPYRNNAWEEFYRALWARSLGLVEAKAPLGFVFWTDDPYGIERPGRMFYKHLEGIDLNKLASSKDESLKNWALWEAGKFFSRLINTYLFLRDSDRLGNYFIEINPSVKIFRFLDLEWMTFEKRGYSDLQKAEMLAKFINQGVRCGFITPDKVGEFIVVCLAAHSAKAIPLIFSKLDYPES